MTIVPLFALVVLSSIALGTMSCHSALGCEVQFLRLLLSILRQLLVVSIASFAFPSRPSRSISALAQQLLLIALERQMMHSALLRGHSPQKQSCAVFLAPVLMTPLPLAGPVSMPRPCSPILVGFPGFAHVSLTYPETLMTLLGKLLWSLGETAHLWGL